MYMYIHLGALRCGTQVPGTKCRAHRSGLDPSPRRTRRKTASLMISHSVIVQHSSLIELLLV